MEVDDDYENVPVARGGAKARGQGARLRASLFVLGETRSQLSAPGSPARTPRDASRP